MKLHFPILYTDRDGDLTIRNQVAINNEEAVAAFHEDNPGLQVHAVGAWGLVNLDTAATSFSAVEQNPVVNNGPDYATWRS